MELKEIVASLDVVKTWFSPGSSRHRIISDLADAAAEHAGGRDEVKPGDPNLATPGPGVKAPTAVTTVDSVGEVADAPVDSAEQRRAAAQAAAQAAAEAAKQKDDQPTG